MPPAGVENPVRGEGCAQPKWRSQTPGPRLVRAGTSDGWYRKSPSQAHPRSASGLRSSWKLQGLGRMVGPRTKGSLRPFPEAPWAALGVCSWGWRDKDQGQGHSRAHTNLWVTCVRTRVFLLTHTLRVCACLLSTRVCGARLCGHVHACACRASTVGSR